MNNNTLDRINLLQAAMFRWLGETKGGRQAIMADIAKAITDHDLWSSIGERGVSFGRTNVICHDLQMAAKKLFRWLEMSSDNTPFDPRIFHIEHCIVAAMPACVRLSYLNSVYKLSRLALADAKESGAACSVNAHIVPQTLKMLAKESMEAQGALLDLVDGIDPGELDKAEKEILEMQAAAAAALANVRHLKEQEG